LEASTKETPNAPPHFARIPLSRNIWVLDPNPKLRVTHIYCNAEHKKLLTSFS